MLGGWGLVMPKKRWLKKYTKLEYLEQILKEQKLHLGNPGRWPDKNDGRCIQAFSDGAGKYEILGTCLTGAKDRFHFWHVFGEQDQGVCLWFERSSLIKDIEADQSLIAREVKYLTPQKLAVLDLDWLPFAKREQYRDESEFRVLRTCAAPAMAADKFSFSPKSLSRIYLNPWLSQKQVSKEKMKVADLLGADFNHINVKQNRTLKQKAWFDAVSEVVRAGR